MCASFLLLNVKPVDSFNFSCNMSNNECEPFISGSRHRATDESTRPQAECFYCFKVSGTPDETLSMSF